MGVIVCRGARLAVLWAVVAAGCASDDTMAPPGVEVDDDLQIEVVADGFDRPTQLAAAGDGRFVLGQLAGGENEAAGELLVVSADFAERQVVQRNLDKPTGVAVVDGVVFVQERHRVTRSELRLGAPVEEIVGELPDNGRSQGSLTPGSAGELFFASSGSKRGSERVPDSASLWRISDAAAPAPTVEVFATGFKHAYAHTRLAGDGSLFTVEMTDGSFDGRPGQDELVRVQAGDDGGWPFCVDDNMPVVEFGGTADRCAASPPSHALFGVSATPTAVVVAPWDDQTLLVSLWIEGTVVAVPIGADGAPHAGDVVVRGIGNPQSMLVDGDRVLVVDHSSGTIYALSAR